jgi:hypothetical protein
MKRDMEAHHHQEFMRGIGGLSLAEMEGENMNESLEGPDWNVMRLMSPAKQREVVDRNPGGSMARSFSTAVRSLKRRVVSREE